MNELNILNKLVKIVAVAGFMTVIPTMSFAYDGIVGGWVEGEGYFSNSEVRSSGPVHRGWTEVHPTDGSLERAVGETTWKSVDIHYTRAQMVNRFTDGVVTDSGRKYGIGTSKAYSPYADRAHIAKTYYGR